MIRVPHQAYSKGSEQLSATPGSPSTSSLVPTGTPSKVSRQPAVAASRPSGTRFRPGVVLTLRTDKPEAEVGLYDKNGKQIAYETWQAHRQLAETIHLQIAKILQFVSGELNDIDGTVVYKGPGSYTGLRIGMSVANALAYSLGCGVVAVTGEGWQTTGVKRLLVGENDKVATPLYEAPAKTTTQRK